MDQEFRYYAFISYQRKDEKWADWLRNKLEHYRLPSNLRKQDSSLPKEIRPVFRDALELSGGLLAEEIASALKQSKFLVVLCSPNSAKSPWVDKEIQTFIDSGRARYIIPFIIDGVPFSGDPETECFPPALRSLSGEQEVLGINIKELGRNAAAVKVVARMFGLKFDSLWQRYERERKRKLSLILSAALFVVLLTIFLVIRSVKQREWRMLENQSRDIAEMAIQRMDKKDTILARRLAAAALPADVNHPKDRPYVPNAEYALWYSWGHYLSKNSTISHKNVDFIKTFDGHVDYYAISVNFSPDGKRIVSCDFNIHLLDAATGEQIKVLEGHSPWIRTIVFSLDGKRIASGGDEKIIRIWDSETGEQKGVLEGHTGTIWSITFSPDGKRIASGGDDKTIRIWDVETGKQIRALEGHTETINSLAFSPDGNRIASGSDDKTIRIWDAETGKQIRILEGGRFMTYSIDKKQIVSIGDEEIRFWDAKSLELIKASRLKMMEKGASVRHLDIDRPIVASPDGSCFASSNMARNGICIWDAETGEPMKVLLDYWEIMSLAFSPDGTQLVFSAADDLEAAKRVNIWNLSLESLLEKTRSIYPPLTPEERGQYFTE